MPLPCVVLTCCPGSFYHVLEEIRGSQAYMTWPAFPSTVPWVSCFHHTGRAMSNTWHKVAWEGKGKKTSTPELQRQYSSYLYWISFSGNGFLQFSMLCLPLQIEKPSTPDKPLNSLVQVLTFTPRFTAKTRGRNMIPHSLSPSTNML